MGDNYTIVEFLGTDGGHRCGYCKNEEGNHNKGMWAHEMTPKDYQDLIDRGWRRSGKYCYKPSMSIMCCPSYTIKCAANKFVLSKSQKKNLKSFTKYIATGERGKNVSREIDDDPVADENEEDGGGKEVKPVTMHVTSLGSGDGDATMKSAEDISASSSVELSTGTPSSSASSTANPVDAAAVDAASVGVESNTGELENRKKNPPARGKGADPTKPKALKAKQLRMERKMAKRRGAGEGGGVGGRADNSSDANAKSAIRENFQSDKSTAIASSSSPGFHSLDVKNDVRKSLEQLIVESENIAEPKVKFDMKLIKSNPPSEEFEATFDESFQLYKKYQMTIHNDKEDKCTARQFKRFLCHSPLFPAESGDADLPFGSYHQHYYIDGRLIAVGVVDILPYCLSSVYLYYDPDFHFLTLGTFSALREIYFTQQLMKRIPSIKYYYMGFYIHSCPKMRYKGAYSPSFLLCPEVNTWHDIQLCKPKLDINKYQRFNQDSSAVDEGEFDGNLSKVKILHKGFPMPYEIFRKYKVDADDQDEVKEYAGLVGKCTRSILLYRQ